MGGSQVFDDPYTVCGREGITICHASSDDLDGPEHDGLADYDYSDVRILLAHGVRS